MSLKHNLNLHEGEGQHFNVQNHEKSPARKKLALPNSWPADPLSDMMLQSDPESQNWVENPCFNVQTGGFNLQVDRHSTDSTDGLQLWPSVVNSAPEQLGGADTNRNEHITDIGTAPVEEQICFGMLIHEKVKLVGKGEDLRGKIMTLKQSNLPRQVFQIKSSAEGEVFLMFPDGAAFGHMSEKAKRTFGQLIQLSQIELETWISPNDILDVLKLAKTSAEAAIRVDIHVYGLNTRRDQFGRQISKGNFFLQHPDTCRPGIRYDNPHILRFDDEEELDIEDIEEEGDFAEEEENLSVGGNEDFQEIIATVFQSLRRPENLNRLKETENLTGSLFPHQEEALDFMTQRETGEISPEYRLWQPKMIDGEQIFSHTITGDRQRDEQDESGGGILADEMGMGKSLTTLALIGKTTGDARKWLAHSNALPKGSLAGEPCRATLLIVPQQLLINHWTREIDKYFKGSLEAVVYHGRARRKLVAGIEDCDVVITTYNTLAREHDNKLLGKGQSPLHDFLWYRIVLDEAHIIRRPETTFHKAASSLLAKSRWCLSGAPIQNRLADLASLLVFLKFRPFHEARTFQHWIGQPFEKKEARQRAVQRLTTLLNAICLRRTIERVELPGKRQETRTVEFSPEERDQYERTFSTMQRFIQQQAGEHIQQKTVGIFQIYLQLRSLCNHGTYQRKLEWVPRDLLDDEAEPVRSISRDDYQRCQVCRQKLPIVPRHRRRNHSGNCRHKICDECAEGHTQATNSAGELHCPLCESLLGLQLNGAAFPGSSQINMNSSESSSATGKSSKMRALLCDVRNGLEQNKSIIFSCWTRTLDLIARHFVEAEINFERIDGKTQPTQRQKILDAFNNTSRVPILIMTTGTCAFGLNIPSANRIFIVEPQWNPTVEDQAISRAIRLGQSQQVLVIRYHVKDSIEDDMRTQQSNKLKISRMDFGKEM